MAENIFAKFVKFAENTFAKFVKLAENIFAEFVKFADLICRLYATVTAVPDAVTINMPLFSPSTS